jgi:hypothetical protein
MYERPPQESRLKVPFSGRRFASASPSVLFFVSRSLSFSWETTATFAASTLLGDWLVRSSKWIVFLWLLPLGAQAVTLSLRLEPGISLPLSAPQVEHLGPGGGGTLKGALGFGRVFDVQVAASVFGYSARLGDPSSLFTAGGGPRLKIPTGLDWLSTFIDGDALFVRTGALDRPGYSVGGGVLFSADRAQRVWLGVFVRYLQVIEPPRGSIDGTDAKMLIVGLATEVRSRLVRQDIDKDGLSDDRDRCPQVSGPIANSGCPTAYAPPAILGPMLVDSNGDGSRSR